MRSTSAKPLIAIRTIARSVGWAAPSRFFQRVHSDVHRIGRRVGTLLLANVLGSILGTIVTGWLSFTILGTASTLKLLAAISGLFALGAALAKPVRHWRFVVLTSLPVVVLMLWMPDAEVLWARLQGTTVAQIIFAEDNSDLSVIKTESAGPEGTKIGFVNGMGQSVLPYGEVHIVLGALRAVHSDPVAKVPGILLGSDEPFDVDPASIAPRLADRGFAIIMRVRYRYRRQ